MFKKLAFIPVFLLTLIILLSACGGEPTPFTPEILTKVNCDPSDFPGSANNYVPIDSRPPDSRMFVGGAPIESVSVAYNEIASTRQSFDCSLFIFGDTLAAQTGFESACDEIRPPFRYPNIGEQACRGQEREGEVVLIVRSGDALIWIWADDNGNGIETVAGRILDRLNR